MGPCKPTAERKDSFTKFKPLIRSLTKREKSHKRHCSGHQQNHMKAHPPNFSHVNFPSSFPFLSLPTIHLTTMPAGKRNPQQVVLSVPGLQVSSRQRWWTYKLAREKKSTDHVTWTKVAPGGLETHQNHVMHITMGLRCEEAVRMNADPSRSLPLTSCAAQSAR